MTKEEKAKETYLRITSYAPYSEMNGIPRETFESKIAEAIGEYVKQEAIDFIKWAVDNYSVDYEGFGFPVYIRENGESIEYNAEQLYELYIKQNNETN